MVAEGVVDGLEAVEVQQHQRELAVLTLGMGDGLMQAVAEVGTVGQTREGVVVGKIAIVLLGRAALGDILDDGDEMAGLALLVADHGHREIAPDHRAAFLDIAFFYAVGVDLALHQLVDPRQIHSDIIGMGHLLKGSAFKFLAGITQDLAQPLIHPDPAPIQPHMGNAHGGLFEGRPKAGLAFAQGFFGARPLDLLAAFADHPLQLEGRLPVQFGPAPGVTPQFFQPLLKGLAGMDTGIGVGGGGFMGVAGPDSGLDDFPAQRHHEIAIVGQLHHQRATDCFRHWLQARVQAL